MDKEKLQKTLEVLDEYEKRFAQARLEKPFVMPTQERTRREIREKVKAMLGYDEALLPSVGNMEQVSCEDMGAYAVEQLRYSTWKNTWGCASLYLPKKGTGLPLAFLLCGHGAEGRLSHGYRAMARDLACMGLAVLVPDNIGQGDRERMGHWNSIGPFYAGLTLQGLIVMETVALIRHMQKDMRFDRARFAALGNSGGGTLTLMLAALCPELAALCSSGYPGEFHYILSKERPHCACNLLPGCAAGPEMWEIYSLFAPKPLLLEQGVNDGLIPVEYFLRNARKVQAVYALMDAENEFESAVSGTNHPWGEEDRRVICNFLAGRLGMEEKTESGEVPEEIPPGWRVSLPEDMCGTDALAEALTGKKMPEGTRLCDIFRPVFRGEGINETQIVHDLGRGSVMQVLAQMECALRK